MCLRQNIILTDDIAALAACNHIGLSDSGVVHGAVVVPHGSQCHPARRPPLQEKMSGACSLCLTFWGCELWHAPSQPGCDAPRNPTLGRPGISVAVGKHVLGSD